MKPERIALVVTALAVGLAPIACGEEVTTSSPAAAGSARAAKKQVDAGLEGGAPDAAPPPVAIQENEWVESERSRDPFRSFANMFVEEARSRVKSQREVILDNFALDELKLVGIVLRSNPPVAMLVDQTGKGHTIKRGQFVGRPEVVQEGHRGAAYEVNWRVDRIRDGDVVFIREDPQNPDVPSATKVIPLRPESALGISG
jgi:type IV pilus assembly protein PilP